jgi:hypothetical protein
LGLGLSFLGLQTGCLFGFSGLAGFLFALGFFLGLLGLFGLKGGFFGQAFLLGPNLGRLDGPAAHLGFALFFGQSFLLAQDAGLHNGDILLQLGLGLEGGAQHKLAALFLLLQGSQHLLKLEAALGQQLDALLALDLLLI